GGRRLARRVAAAARTARGDRVGRGLGPRRAHPPRGGAGRAAGPRRRAGGGPGRGWAGRGRGGVHGRRRAGGEGGSVTALAYTVDGPREAPVLVLGSSLGPSGAMWDPQIPALAEHLRVVRYDHRGHGRSPVPDGPYDLADLGADVLSLMDALQ